MGVKKQVIAGDYIGSSIIASLGTVQIVLGFTKAVYINADTVASYEVLDEEHRKSASSGIMRGAVGAALLGPVGLLAGVSAKSKGAYRITISFKDGKQSLIEVDEKIYKVLMKALFTVNQGQTEGEKQQMPSETDELLKWKGLLDQGVITVEEFEAKKKQLLGL